jgi:hypothetical protein
VALTVADPTFTEDTLLKLVPVTATWVPPVDGPVFGDSEVTVAGP